MQYKIDSAELAPSKSEITAIDAKIKLSLVRFNDIIVKCDIKFWPTISTASKPLIVCTIKVRCVHDIHFIVTDTARDIQASFTLALGRLKRNIDRHLKRSKTTRY